MTARRETMACLSAADARWDAEAGKVRYFACFEGTEEWIEVPGEDFDRLTRLLAQEAIGFVCDSVSTTLDRVNGAMEKFMDLRKTMEAMMPKPTSAPPPEDKEN